MRESIGYSAYNIFEDVYEYNENECFIADSIESLRDFLKGSGFLVENYRAMKVHISDILDDYGASGGRYCMELEALKRFEQASRITGTTYSQEEYDEDVVNVEVDLSANVYQPGKISPNSQKAELSSKIIQTKEKAIVVSFSSYKNRFLIYKQVCTNPNCPGNHIFLSFVEVDDQLKPMTNPLSFLIQLDLETGKEIAPPERPENINRMVEEFFNDLTEEMKAALLSEIHSLKSDQKRLDEYRFDVRDVLDGLLVPYTTIVSDKGSITRGGKEVSFRMLHKGHEYLIEDLYCSNPDCDCKKVHLQFFKVLRELSGKPKPGIIDCFMAEMSLKKGRMQIYELFKSNKQDAKELIRAWKVQHPDILNLLQDRYRQIKEIGERSLKGKELHKIPDSVSKPLSKSVVREKKIGRNEPCPCGSGKKYKKCCGA